MIILGPTNNDLARLAKLKLYDGGSMADVNRAVRNVPMVSADIGSPVKKFIELARSP